MHLAQRARVLGHERGELLGQRLRLGQLAQLGAGQRGGVERAGALRQRLAGKAGLRGLAGPGAQHVDAGRESRARAATSTVSQSVASGARCRLCTRCCMSAMRWVVSGWLRR
jgi:hypothetical protein